MTNTNTPTRTASRTTQIRSSSSDSDCILVFQGGGALGAYQAGMFEALSEDFPNPAWVAGISIGAINAALIAGNAVHARVAHLRDFWELVSSSVVQPSTANGLFAREALNEASSMQVMMFGVPGFFVPRFPLVPFQPRGSLGAISYYDTAPLRQTLERLIDFELINSGPVRLSVGAVNIRTGNFEYFDSSKQRIDVRHIMASAALPPGFAPVEIDGEYFWDGGLVSNTPLQYVLDQPGQRNRVVFQADLFSAIGELPTTMAEVTEREKDIRFSSRTRLNTTYALDRHKIANSAHRLIQKLPIELRHDPDVLALTNLRSKIGVEVVHLIYRSKHFESQSKDYEFSRQSVREHWESGHADMRQTLQDPRWQSRQSIGVGVHVFDLKAERTTFTRAGQ